MSRQGRRPNETKDRVPLFGSWRNAYCAVVIFFVIDVVVFWAFGRYFS